MKPPELSTDYGQLYYSPSRNGVYYVTGDADGNGPEIDRLLSALPGIDSVKVEAEVAPPQGDWIPVSRNGRPVTKADDLSGAPWRGSPSHFTDDQWRHSCVLDRGATFHPEDRYALPVRARRHPQPPRAWPPPSRLVQVNAPAAAKTAARAELVRLYDEAGLSAPASIAKADAASGTCPSGRPTGPAKAPTR